MGPDKENKGYLSVVAGSAVKTSDEQSIGTISEIRGNHFKIKRPWWQRDFWLRTDCVRSASPEHGVVLNVDKAHLEDTKIVDGPPE